MATGQGWAMGTLRAWSPIWWQGLEGLNHFPVTAFDNRKPFLPCFSVTIYGVPADGRRPGSEPACRRDSSRQCTRPSGDLSHQSLCSSHGHCSPYRPCSPEPLPGSLAVQPSEGSGSISCQCAEYPRPGLSSAPCPLPIPLPWAHLQAPEIPTPVQHPSPLLLPGWIP